MIEIRNAYITEQSEDKIMRYVTVPLLAALLAASIGGVLAEEPSWQEVTADGKKWQIVELPGGSKTCAIKPGEESVKKGAVAIPSKVKVGGTEYAVIEVGKEAFMGCKELRSITIPSGVTAIRDKAFEQCSALREVTMPESLNRLGSRAFARCSSLAEVVIPNSVESIETEVFTGCSVLASVQLPSALKTFAPNAFTDCAQLASFSIGKDSPNYSVADGVLLDKSGDTIINFPRGRKGSYALPSSVKAIGDYAFSTCKGLTSLSFNAGLMRIGEGAFEDCAGLTVLHLPVGLKHLEYQAFRFCTSLREVSIPRGLERIANEIFSGCEQLKTVYWHPDARFMPSAEALRGIPKAGITLYVRRGQKTKIAAQRWAAGLGIEEAWVVTFAVDGTAIEEQMVRAGEHAHGALAPQRANSHFMGWTRHGQVYDLTKETVTEDITLEARWGYMVRFDANGGALAAGSPSELIVQEGTKVTAPAAPTKEGNVFAGWFLNGQEYKFDAPVTSPLTLIAQWGPEEKGNPEDQKGPDKETPSSVESIALAGARLVSNPFGDALVVEGIEAAVRIEVYDACGALVAARELHGEKRLEFPTHRWAGGVYFIRMMTHNGARIIKGVRDR